MSDGIWIPGKAGRHRDLDFAAGRYRFATPFAVHFELHREIGVTPRQLTGLQYPNRTRTEAEFPSAHGHGRQLREDKY
ncbi:MAG TPA: hypothetical protein VNS60_02565 [Solirubrobacterales bacterium]|nr:hypothetical protein [Solirubrobacterales bacterium]